MSADTFSDVAIHTILNFTEYDFFLSPWIFSNRKPFGHSISFAYNETEHHSFIGYVFTKQYKYIVSKHVTLWSLAKLLYGY